ncbi:hypothetical protein [Corynebacterium heidelbergense]|uniref:Uncharacterized protein n=1 Tax=Corynebacterium heidelbergense TaxID=2055947 RepID=A0A364VDA9_9CORY|nr:hypothetical protein [Corynebacterium heidelbergense]RAV34620.1 hypothetical protein CWC39_02105 [Corynebacterium heidelbergense]WCZ36182.1 hypothetical protein CHEID_03110 [Corynebacterium heidelbergense]WCZ37637.1 hypothetical protein CHEID_10600 [Corynebacterium heidelbergense]
MTHPSKFPTVATSELSRVVTDWQRHAHAARAADSDDLAGIWEQCADTIQTVISAARKRQRTVMLARRAARETDKSFAKEYAALRELRKLAYQQENLSHTFRQAAETHAAAGRTEDAEAARECAADSEQRYERATAALEVLTSHMQQTTALV